MVSVKKKHHAKRTEKDMERESKKPIYRILQAVLAKASREIEQQLCEQIEADLLGEENLSYLRNLETMQDKGQFGSEYN